MVKRQLIIEKALELFAKQGFEATSVQQITEYCGISKGAFYLSFKSKEELILSLIEHSMSQFISEIDYAVNNMQNDRPLYSFFYRTFIGLLKHSNMAKLFIKDQGYSFSDELFLKIRYYDSLTDRIILEMLEKLYGEEIEATKYDLMYCIKGFIQTYSGMFLFNEAPLDVSLLSQTLVEKTDILAKHSTLSFISKDMMEVYEHPQIAKETLLEMLEQKINEIDEPIEKESLVLLKQHLIEPSLSPAIVKGLIENIRNHPHCKWLTYLLRKEILNDWPDGTAPLS
ncbi:TetR/AcrR family transcriptional regulator [Robertmurraya andreesenii]|uniref:AcrR family transcriptional regulator n=1 Tax=Anoxybacillus andreesenii TaxID=1325932 RepID=A0ABT9V483_9BACL|nr:TetR/AcrR family transcriptional regulator [Robertmurraya andreesenii]MDQ0155751.1 AcrR family transcriptional regulator [Robertmurraya andreesenii]